MQASKAAAALEDRDFETPDDVKSLLEPALRHRLILRPEAEVAGQTRAELEARPRSVEGVFDAGGLLVLEYRTRPPRRGVYPFAAVDVRIWRSGGWWLRQFRLPLPARAAVYPDVLAIRRWQLT